MIVTAAAGYLFKQGLWIMQYDLKPINKFSAGYDIV